jgi:hypothetical protein
MNFFPFGHRALKPKTTVRYRVFEPGRRPRWQTQGRHSTDPRVVYIKTTCREVAGRQQCTLKGKWAPKSEDPKRVTLRPNERLEAHADRLFTEFKEGSTSGLPAIPLGIMSTRTEKGWEHNPAGFLAGLRGVLARPGPDHQKRTPGHVYGESSPGGKNAVWMKRESFGTRGDIWVATSFPSFWVVPMSTIGATGGVVVFEETRAGASVHWPRHKRPEPWNKAIHVETYEEGLAAVKSLVGPFAEKLYAADSLPAMAAQGQSNQRDRPWWKSLIHRL